jgi:hypothetical protein
MTRKHPASTVDRSLAVKYFDKAALRAFQTILNRKDAVSYLDDIVDDAEAAALLERLGAFSRWAEKTFADLRRRAPAP